MKKLLNEQPKAWWFETMALMWHHCVCFAHACRVPATLENMHWPVQSNYNDVIMGAMAFQITSATSVYSSVYSGEDQRKHQSSASLAFVRGIHRSPVNSPHKWLVTRKMFPFDDVIMRYLDHQKRHSDGHPLSHMSIAKPLTHWALVMHICVHNLTIIGSDNGLSPDRCQAIILTNAGILLNRTVGTNFSEILSEIHTFSFKKMHLKLSSAKWQPWFINEIHRCLFISHSQKTADIPYMIYSNVHTGMKISNFK